MIYALWKDVLGNILALYTMKYLYTLEYHNFLQIFSIDLLQRAYVLCSWGYYLLQLAVPLCMPQATKLLNKQPNNHHQDDAFARTFGHSLFE
jgi:hypothetical protein